MGKKIPINKQVEYEVNRIKSGEISPDLFFAKGIGIQNSKNTYSTTYANDRFEATCETLCTVGYCNSSMCIQCKLKAAHEKALKDILAGERTSKIRKTGIVMVNGLEHYMVTITDRKTGIITKTYYPIEGNKDASYWDFISQEEIE